MGPRDYGGVSVPAAKVDLFKGRKPMKPEGMSAPAD